MTARRLFPVVLSALAACQPVPPRPLAVPPSFADEFGGSSLDRTKWTVETEPFWVNNEQQVYVDHPDTLEVRGGVLILRPRFAPGAEDSERRRADFVSARIHTRGRFSVAHGRAAARIRMSGPPGIWPAWWLLGEGDWPDHGEIDIMEYVGEKGWTGVAMHGPGYSGDTPIVRRFHFPAGTDVGDWHVYAAEWDEQKVVFLVDEVAFYTVPRATIERYGPWRFDEPKYLILNLAVGGSYPQGVNRVEAPYPGVPQATVDAVKAGKVRMEVDWVRVWARP